MKRLLLCLCLGVLADASAQESIPLLVRDESAGRWVVDRFAGNSTAGTTFFQGTATEAGGVGRGTSFAVAPDGRTFFPVSEGIAEVSPAGVLRLVVSRHEWRADGLEDLYGRGGLVAWNPREQCLYFWGNHCIRKLIEHADGSHEVAHVVGHPDRPGTDDGPAAKASLNSVGNLCINGRGEVFFYDGRQYGQSLRKFANGTVTTLSTRMRSGKLVDGPLSEAQFNFINLGGLNSIGENDDVLYIADHWNYAVRRIDLKAAQVTTVFGMRQPAKDSPLAKRFNHHSDGPALTHGSCNSGIVFSVYDPVHGTLWFGGPDEGRLRWLKDGWGRTVVGATPGDWQLDGPGNPADKVKMSWCWVLAVDAQGRAYAMNGASRTGYWRLSEKKGAGQ